ncbi:MAG: hypothetical protein LQ349_005271 [Xanthoria aureola]|nr:MAG: hypothetical protein LQ349_005271 [Xanthoria aureola]
MNETAPDPPSLAVNEHSSGAQPSLQNGDSDSDSDSLRSLCASLHSQITAFLQEDVPTETLRAVQAQTKKSLAIIQQALDRYPLPSLSLSYNGGKDCLVLLILYLSLLPTHPSLPSALPAIYIPPSHPFATVTAFTLASAHKYHLRLDIHAADDDDDDDDGNPQMAGKGQGGGAAMKEAFAQYLARNPGVEAIFVGTRRTDPHGGKLSAGGFDVTDGGWPRFMRVHPVIEWHYVEVWAFLRHLKIPYCKLYDLGYTSLGGTNDTHPNPALKVEGSGGSAIYRPAYELEEDREERLGRDW